MANIKSYYGSMGPFLHDPTDDILDPDGDFPGTGYHALVTDGQLIVEEAPTLPDHVAKKINIDELEAQLESTSFYFARIY